VAGFDFEEDEDALSIKGEIDISSVPDLLRSLLASNETGLLTFRHGEDQKTLSVIAGRIVYASSNNPDERLGETLLIRGKITVRQYVEASAQIRPGRRLGAILVDLNAVEPEDLLPAVEYQVRETLMELFTWSRGSYEFVIKDLDAESMVTVSLNTDSLLLEGIRRSRSWSQVLRGIGSIDSVFTPTGNTDVLYKLELTEDEQEVLGRVNGRQTVEQICDVSYLSHFETCRILWALQVLGLVRRPQAADAERVVVGEVERERELDLEDIVEKFNQMFSRAYTFLKGRMGDEVDVFMDHVLEEVSRQYGTLFAGVDLRHYGRADFEQILANVADLPAAQRKSLVISALNELTFVIQLNVRTARGAQEEAVVSGIIKDGLKRLGTT
jgi:hypothetical protein